MSDSEETKCDEEINAASGNSETEDESLKTGSGDDMLLKFTKKCPISKLRLDQVFAFLPICESRVLCANLKGMKSPLQCCRNCISNLTVQIKKEGKIRKEKCSILGCGNQFTMNTTMIGVPNLSECRSGIRGAKISYICKTCFGRILEILDLDNEILKNISLNNYYIRGSRDGYVLDYKKNLVSKKKAET